MSHLNAIVTGGAHGIGFGITQSLLEQGANVVVADINEARGQEALDKLKALNLPGKAAFQICDVSSWSSQVSVFAATHAKFGRIDLVFANAGIAQAGPEGLKDAFVLNEKEKSLETLADQPPNLRVIDVNLTGALYSIHAAIAYFRAQEPGKDGKRGRIVVTGSNAMIYPFPVDSLYGTAKTALLGTVRALAPRLEPEGITINALAPAIVDTGLPLPPNTYKLDLITPMKTITDACKKFYENDSAVTGQVAECCKSRIIFRKFPAALDERARSSMDQFWSQDQIESVLLNFHGHESY